MTNMDSEKGIRPAENTNTNTKIFNPWNLADHHDDDYDNDVHNVDDDTNMLIKKAQ